MKSNMKITYRSIEESDLEDRVRWFNDPEVGRYISNSYRNGTTLKKQQDWYQKHLGSKTRKTFVILADGKPVGNVALLEISKIDRNAGIFIAIGDKNYWGQGIAKQALEFITDYGFKKQKLHKIWLHVYELNQRAIGLYKKFGFAEEGRHKEMIFIDNKFSDEIFMSLINPEEK